jgi:LacI family transcriptional regulator
LAAAGGKHPTIYDVATRAGVSIGTVSRALNSPAKVAEATRQRVLGAVRELRFEPKEAATSRARRSSGRIGVFAPFSAYPSFAERLNGILTARPQRRAEVVVFDVQSAAESAHTLESLPPLRCLDGVIVMSVPISPQVAAALQEGRLPAVFVDVEGTPFPSVRADDHLGGELAAGALAEAGLTRFAFLGHRQARADFASPSRRRLEGFQAGLAARALSLDQSATALTGRSFDEAVAAATGLLAGADGPIGVFAHTDELAAACHLAARRLGRRIPQEVGIVGFDDSAIAAALDLTTIRQPLRETGAWALRTLAALIEQPAAAPPSLTLPVRLVRRGSA